MALQELTFAPHTSHLPPASLCRTHRHNHPPTHLHAQNLLRGATAEALHQQRSQALGELAVAVCTPVELAVRPHLRLDPHLVSASVDQSKVCKRQLGWLYGEEGLEAGR